MTKKLKLAAVTFGLVRSATRRPEIRHLQGGKSQPTPPTTASYRSQAISSSKSIRRGRHGNEVAS